MSWRPSRGPRELVTVRPVRLDGWMDAREKKKIPVSLLPVEFPVDRDRTRCFLCERIRLPLCCPVKTNGFCLRRVRQQETL